VGPAGRLLHTALGDAGIPRDRAYLTNAVKHFRWRPAPSGGKHDDAYSGLVKDLQAAAALLASGD
jgi:DNA polymerase